MKSTTIFFIIFSSFLSSYLSAQFHINKEWEQVTGNPFALEWTSSITNPLNQLIQVGNTVQSGQGANVLISKYGTLGTLLWQSTFNSGTAKNDYGCKATQDLAGNIYVVGSTDNGTTDNYDVIVLKYSSSGTLIWSKTYGASFNKNDVGIDIKVDLSGNVYVCASSESNTTGYDFLVLKYTTGGILSWSKRYDYNALTEIPVGIDFDLFGRIIVIGTSATSVSDWDYTIVKYSTGGAFLGDYRHVLAGANFDQPLAYHKDASGNVYVTGKSSVDGINFNIKTVKFNSSFLIDWEQVIDFSGQEDSGASIDVDGFGNVYVGGFVTATNNQKELFIVKYNALGNQVWVHNQPALVAATNIEVKAMDVIPSGEVYLVAEETPQAGSATKKGVVSKLDTNGDIEWQKKLSSGVDEQPVSINRSGDGGIYVTAIKANNTYKTIRYTEFKQDTSVVLNSQGDPVFKAKELIVRFQPSAINTAAIDNAVGSKEIEFGGLETFLTISAMKEIDRKTRKLCDDATTNPNPCGITAIKIFKQLKTTHISTISRMGETIPIPDFWTTLLLQLPDSMDMLEIHNIFKTLPVIIAYSEPNYIADVTDPPNDYLYSTQHSLFSYDYEDAHTNMEEAWDIYPNAGESYIKCGVFDQGINFRHEDFGFITGAPNSGKVIAGWDFETNVDIKTLSNPDDGHGTPCAGIIGAIRNNNEIGIAGIAGGNFIGSTGLTDKGIGLYALRILSADEPGLFSNSLSYIYDAIVMASIDNDSLDYAYGLHLASNSWRINQFFTAWTDTNLTLLGESTHFANRAKMSFVAAHGNDGLDIVCPKAMPSNIDDDWIISVGGTGLDGGYKSKFNGDPPTFAASVGYNIDIAAPSVTELVTSTKNHPTEYQSFSGTSAATPHVAGVVGLLLSYLNESDTSYHNLSPEDCEHIIELSATDLGFIEGYDDTTGWGRLNAGAALRLVEKPFNKVLHFGTNAYSPHTKTITSISTDNIILLREQYRNLAGMWFPKGNYKLNAYRIDATVNNTIATNDTIIAFWSRASSSTVLESIVGDSLLPRERVAIGNCTSANTTLSGYVYEVFDLSNNPLGWWPFDTTLSLAQLEYTVIARDKFLIVDEKPKGNNFVSIYPNPTTHQQTISIQTTIGENLSIDLYDLQGRKLRNVYQGNTTSEKMIIENNVADLSPALYFYRIDVGSSSSVARFVKQ